jgi:hypothetical protein
MGTTTDTSMRQVAQRVLTEGYGGGAWHGPDLKAALADVEPDTAFTRPAMARHNIAEIALHHAYCAHSVRARLSGKEPEPFIVEGDDGFEASDASRLSWSRISEVVGNEQQQLAQCLTDIDAGRSSSPLGESERFDLVLGITCHAVYHAGQIQLIKRLIAR